MSDNEHDEPLPSLTTTVLLQRWIDLGEALFTDGETIVLPTLKTVRMAVDLFAVELALTVRNGNMTHAAQDLAVSRRSIRDRIQRANRYPWPLNQSLEFSVLDSIRIPE